MCSVCPKSFCLIVVIWSITKIMTTYRLKTDRCTRYCQKYAKKWICSAVSFVDAIYRPIFTQKYRCIYTRCTKKIIWPGCSSSYTMNVPSNTSCPQPTYVTIPKYSKQTQTRSRNNTQFSRLTVVVTKVFWPDVSTMRPYKGFEYAFSLQRKRTSKAWTFAKYQSLR